MMGCYNSEIVLLDFAQHIGFLFSSPVLPEDGRKIQLKTVVLLII
jgi:hypothetical protein